VPTTRGARVSINLIVAAIGVLALVQPVVDFAPAIEVPSTLLLVVLSPGVLLQRWIPLKHWTVAALILAVSLSINVLLATAALYVGLWPLDWYMATLGVIAVASGVVESSMIAFRPDDPDRAGDAPELGDAPPDSDQADETT
jgi:hypothetical protein